MASGARFSCLFLVLFLRSVSAAGYLSEHVFESQKSTGRQLLQVETNCPENFEFKDYTILTNQCKGPRYPAQQCCKAFQQFACPYADLLNNLTNNCATTMFSYINIAGKYPPGLFASECVGDKKGLSCNGTTTQANTVNGTSDAGIISTSSAVLIALISLVLLVIF